VFYDSTSKHYICKKCGLYITKDELLDLKEKLRGERVENSKKRKHDEYLKWWLSKK